jgi:TonB family protein
LVYNPKKDKLDELDNVEERYQQLEDRLKNDSYVNKSLNIIKAFKKELKTCLVLYNQSLDTLIYEYSVADDIIILEGYERLQNKLKGRVYYPTEIGAFFSSDGQRIEITKSDSLFLNGVEIGKKKSSFIFLFNFQLNDKVFKMGLETYDRFFDNIDKSDNKLEFESLDTQGKELERLSLIQNTSLPFTASEIEESPIYPGCDNNVSREDGLQCLSKKIGELISKKVKYPKMAAQMGIQGRVYFSFVIKKDGNVSDVKIVRSIDKLLDDEALRVINLLPQMTPARVNGKAVSMSLVMSIPFRLK